MTVSDIAAQREQRLRDYFAATDAWEVDRYGEFLHPRVSFRFGNADALDDLAAVQTLASAMREAVAGMRHEVVRVLHDAGRSAATVELVVEYTRPDGRALRFPAAVVVHFDADDLIDEFRVYVDLAGLFDGSTT